MEKIIKNKRGIFFSLIALFIVMILVLNFRVATRVDVNKNKISAQNIRIKIMNGLVYDLEERHFEKMISVASKASLKIISENRGKIDNLGEDFESMILYGNFTSESTIYNSEFNIHELISQLEEKFKEVGLIIDKLEIKAELTQDDPWFVNINANIKYIVTDSEGLVGWRGKINKIVRVDVNGFETSDGTITSDWKSSSYCSSLEPAKSCGGSFLERMDSSYSGPGICNNCV